MEDSRVVSIQGEIQRRNEAQTPLWADDADVDSYVDGASEEVLECRERGHDYPPTTGTVHFVDVTTDNLLVRDLTCQCCGMAVRQELYAQRKEGNSYRFTLVTAQVVYREGLNGQHYLAPAGRGRITRRQISSSCVTKAFQGQTPAQIRKAAKAYAAAAREKRTEQAKPAEQSRLRGA